MRLCTTTKRQMRTFPALGCFAWLFMLRRPIGTSLVRLVTWQPPLDHSTGAPIAAMRGSLLSTDQDAGDADAGNMCTPCGTRPDADPDAINGHLCHETAGHPQCSFPEAKRAFSQQQTRGRMQNAASAPRP